jgi:hypothetical protein
MAKVAVTTTLFLALIVTMACGDDAATTTASPTKAGGTSPGSALAVLTAVGRSLPQFPDLVADEEYIYTGGELTESIYWSRASVGEVIHFYYEQMPPLRWEITLGPSYTTVPRSEKESGGERSTIGFSRGGFVVTVTAADDPEKDPSRGTTRLGIRIERTDPAATVPPSIPTLPSEGF